MPLINLLKLKRRNFLRLALNLISLALELRRLAIKLGRMSV
jgi:hypothetical protein